MPLDNTPIKHSPGPVIPGAVRICVCQECRQGQSIDPISKAIFAGRYVGESEFKAHQLTERSLAQASHYGLPQIKPEAIGVSKKLLEPSHVQPSAQLPSFHASDLLKKKLFTIRTRLRDCNITKDAKLIFCEPPSRKSRPMLEPKEEVLKLQDNVPVNEAVILRERWLLSAIGVLEEMQAFVADEETLLFSHNLKIDVKQELAVILSLKMLEWERQRSHLCQLPRQVRVVNTGMVLQAVYLINIDGKPIASCISKRFMAIHPVALLCHILVATMYLIFNLSLDQCRFLLASLRLLLTLISTAVSDPTFHTLPRSLPRNAETLVSYMDLEPRTKAFVCCPSCFQIYAFNPEIPNSYPERCTYKGTQRGDACGRPLRRSMEGESRVSKPIRLFLYHELEEWVSELYSRPGMESFLDRDITTPHSDKNNIWDILDSPGIRDFLGPENVPDQPFLKPPGDEGRLIFSLNMDGFNPFMNKESGKKATVGAIYMVCLNLPPAIRYNVENIFLAGIIPGPQEPSKEQINHVLRPLVDDLEQFWLHGFFLTSTPKHPRGRLVRGAIVPLICDLPAARQMSGFAGHASHNFCSFCLTKAEDIENFNYWEWKSRSGSEHRGLAEQWRDAQSDNIRNKFYEEFGVRWSELLRLPYWDPTKFLVIDSMHGFFLRLFQRHCRLIWGMNVDFEDGDRPSINVKNDNSLEDHIANARHILRYKSEAELRGLGVLILRHLAREAELRSGATKKVLLKSLLDYRISRGWFNAAGEVITGGHGDDDEDNGDGGAIIGDGSNLGGADDSDAPITSNASESPHNIEERRRNRDRNDPPTPDEVTRGLKLLQPGSNKKITGLRKALLVHLCNLKNITIPNRCTAAELVDHLEKWRLSDFPQKSTLVDPPAMKKRRNKKGKGTGVLGRETLAEIRADMELLSLPSWVSRAPREPGAAKRGKFTADQWRSFCTINLVFTLTRLWGQEPEGSRKRLMLDNFMHLVTAVKLASMRCMNAERIKDYTHHMHQYLTTLLDLYPDTTITPYQHLALHMSTFLERFGPTHAWRCWPFERYNYLLQKIPTNMKFNEMEHTMLKRFCMGQKLKALFKPEALPRELAELVSEWDEIYGSNIRGTLLGDSLAFDMSFKKQEEEAHWQDCDLVPLHPSWYLSLKHWISENDPGLSVDTIPPRAYLRKGIKRLGELYQNEYQSPADSHVYYRDRDGMISAGCIQGIFSHTRRRQDGSELTQTFFMVKQYKPLSPRHAAYDPYRRSQTVAGQAYHHATFSGFTIISFSELLHHFAYAPIVLPTIGPVIVALPLDRS